MRLKHNRGFVSIIFASLESITLAAGRFFQCTIVVLLTSIPAPISTVFTNTFGSRKITIVGGILAAFGFFLSRLWTNVYHYYITIGLIAGTKVESSRSFILSTAVRCRYRLRFDVPAGDRCRWLLLRSKASVRHRNRRLRLGFGHDRLSLLHPVDDGELLRQRLQRCSAARGSAALHVCYLWFADGERVDVSGRVQSCSLPV